MLHDDRRPALTPAVVRVVQALTHEAVEEAHVEAGAHYFVESCVERVEWGGWSGEGGEGYACSDG